MGACGACWYQWIYLLALHLVHEFEPLQYTNPSRSSVRYSLYHDVDSRIIKDSGKTIEAELKIGTSMMEESYISTVSMEPPKAVNV